MQGKKLIFNENNNVIFLIKISIDPDDIGKPPVKTKA